MPYIIPIKAEEIPSRLVKWLDKSAKVGYYGYEAKHILADALEKTLQLWEVAGDNAEGIIVSKVLQHPAGKEFQVWTMAGKGFLRDLDKLYKELEVYATEHGCKFISGLVVNEQLYKPYEDLGVKTVGQIMYKEL